MARVGPLAVAVLVLVLTSVGATPRCHQLRVNPEAPVQLGEYRAVRVPCALWPRPLPIRKVALYGIILITRLVHWCSVLSLGTLY